MQNLEIISLFPTPVQRVRVQEYFEDELLQLKQLDSQPRYKNGNHFESVESYCLDLPGMEKLKAYIEKQLKDFYVNALAIDRDIMITESRINRNMNGGETNIDYNDGYLVSGVYYMDIPDNRALVNFYKPNIKSTKPFINSELLVNNPYAQTKEIILVSNNEILLFPSHIENSLSKMDVKDDRWFLTFRSTIKPININEYYVD
jgi:hypothetical protein